MKIEQYELTAIGSIVSTLESPHVSYHIDGAANKTLQQSKAVLVALQKKLMKHMLEESQKAPVAPKLEPIGVPKKLSDAQIEAAKKAVKKDKKAK